MPFVATDGESPIAPPQAERGVEYGCLECGNILTVRRAHKRDGHFVARHFWHPHGADGCSGGESPEHERMKSIAYSKVEQRWPDASVGYEVTIADRVADVLVEFEDVDERYGEGIAIEVQHRNVGKDVDAATEDFLEAGYSVLWLEGEHFDGMDVDLDAGEWVVWWAQQVPLADEWTRYHGVVHWLRQTNYASAEIDVAAFPELVYEPIFRAWESYYFKDPAYHPINRVPELDRLLALEAGYRGPDPNRPR